MPTPYHWEDESVTTPGGITHWMGAWVTSTAYSIGDGVQINGSTYICLIAHTSGTFSTDLAALKWDLVASKGDTGAGVAGPPGPTGPAGGVNTVNGHFGDVVLDKTDIGLGNVTNTQQQPIDSDLTALAAISPADGDIIQRVSGSWLNRTIAQLKTALGLTKSDVGLGSVDNLQQQPIDSDLTAIAAISPANDDIIQRKGGTWVNRTMAQLLADLGGGGGGMALAGSDTTDRTTTSASITNLSSVTGLSIPASTPIMIMFDFRKTAGAAEFAFFDILVNGTAIPSENSWTDNANHDDGGCAIINIAPRSTNYLRGFIGRACNYRNGNQFNIGADNAALPSGTITSITVRGRNQSTAANTVATNNLKVYTLP